MDELRGPNIQIVLHVKEGLGFGFLRSPFIVCGSLNGYLLETDPVVPVHAPVFDAELVWEADKRRFRSLRVQNVPIKVEVFTTSTQGRKDKVGYILLSLLGAQPCPASKIIDVKYTWHKLLGVKSEGKCCHPQLLMSLSVEDRINTPTPALPNDLRFVIPLGPTRISALQPLLQQSAERNELRMFHTSEVARPTKQPPTARSMPLTIEEYMAEKKKSVSSPDLQPKLMCDEGLIQVGSGDQLFVLSFDIGCLENLDMLVPGGSNDMTNCYLTYSVFTHTIVTDRVKVGHTNSGSRVQFNQRASLRIRSCLPSLVGYLAKCPRLCLNIMCDKPNDGNKATASIETEIGVCSMDLRKLIPTDDIGEFVRSFCNDDKCLIIHERLFIVRRDGGGGVRRPYVDVEMSLKYVGVGSRDKKPTILSARSATQLKGGEREMNADGVLDNRSGSCTDLDRDVGGVAYTNITPSNTARYKNASGDAVLQTNEIAELIRKMYDSFTLSQEKLAQRPPTSDMQVQCGTEEKVQSNSCEREKYESPKKHLEKTDPIQISKSDTCVLNNVRDAAKSLSRMDRDAVMQKYVEELEDWKERQQELFKYQLKRKEEYHLELLSEEWGKRRLELESKLSGGVERCRHLAADLAKATDDFRLRAYRNSERERKLQDAKKALEAHFTAKYQEVREASQKMEADMNHRLKLKDMRVEELQYKVQQLEKQADTLQNNLKNSEKEAENKYSGLTKDQTASLIQELRCLEEKLEGAIQSKAFFKEQWGRAVRELHTLKLNTRKQMLTQLRHERRQLGDVGLETIEDREDLNKSDLDLKKLKDDFYVDILTNTPALESNSYISTSDGLDAFSDLKSAKNPTNEKLNELITQRDRLIQQDNPDEDVIKQLNHEIRSMLLNCGT